MRTITVDKNPYNRKLFTKDEINIEEGINILVGPNGMGKSTLITFIMNQIRELKDDSIYIQKYDNFYEGGQSAKTAYGFVGDTNALVRAFTSSEGEQIYDNFGALVIPKLKKKIESNKNIKEVWLVLDGLDSGLSIDVIKEVKDFLHFLIDNLSDKKVYIIVAANSYEMTIGEKCIDVNTLKYHKEFKTYNSYSKFIQSKAKIKDKYIENYKRKENKK